MCPGGVGRIVIVGLALIVIAAAFSPAYGRIAPKSNDPEAVMRTVGVVAGLVGTLGIVMIIFGLMAKGR